MDKLLTRPHEREKERKRKRETAFLTKFLGEYYQMCQVQLAAMRRAGTARRLSRTDDKRKAGKESAEGAILQSPSTATSGGNKPREGRRGPGQRAHRVHPEITPIFVAERSKPRVK